MSGSCYYFFRYWKKLWIGEERFELDNFGFQFFICKIMGL